MPMQYTEIFSAVKNENFIGKFLILLILLLILLSIKIFLLTLFDIVVNEAVLTSTRNLFWIRNKKNMYSPVYPNFTI